MMFSTEIAPISIAAGEYTVSIARTDEQIGAAQRLRHDVYTAEFGASLHSQNGLDVDKFDDHCDHLIVRYEPTGAVIGTYRLMPPGRSPNLYSAGEFDLEALNPLLPSLVELGRSCVHPGHRGGAVINLMWSALARYALFAGYSYLAGCGSVPLADGGRGAIDTWRLADAKHTCPSEVRVRPHTPWLPDREFTEQPAYVNVPPLLRGYLRLGAWVCGPPAHDPDFGVADFFILLRLDNISDRYLRYFLGENR